MAIVHNSNYLRIFEEARLFFMEKIGTPYTDIEDAGILIPQVDAYVRYHQTLQYGDVLCVDVKLTDFNGARMKYEYQIHRGADDVLIAEGFTSHCFIDEEARMPLNLKKRMPKAYDVLATHVG
jgi:acyl-CoA thioester hydrolase